MAAGDKLPCALLGATGLVGERLARRLLDHPWFELTRVSAGAARVGRRWADVAVEAELGVKGDLELQPQLPMGDAPPLVFSALPEAQAAEVEAAWRGAGACVISHATGHARRPGVPLLIPEINAAHLDGFETRGGLVAQPNCTTIGLSLALAPLAERFGLERVEVVTLQSLSGAGRAAVQAGLTDDLSAWIPDEEECIRAQAPWILGQGDARGVAPADFAIDASCHRVPIRHGHLIACSVTLSTRADEAALLDAWRDFRGEPQNSNLPSAPAAPIELCADPEGPSPGQHLNAAGGQAITVGRLRPCALNHWRFSLLVDNLERGAAGNAVLTAELLHARRLIGA
jgi:aspartate-semialdehyde dehydrogenase